MTITEVISLAKSGKLKNLAGVANDNEAVLGFINLGLIELYKRFPLKVEEYIVTLVEGQTIYDMPNDFMWIIAAYQEADENSLQAVSTVPVNEEDNPASINTIRWNQVQIPVVATGAYISIIYVAAPPFLVEDNGVYKYTDVDGNEQVITNIPLPPQMIGALLDYIAYEANDTLPNTGEVETKSFYQKFEASCARIEQKGMYSADDLNMIDRNMKGFV